MAVELNPTILTAVSIFPPPTLRSSQIPLFDIYPAVIGHGLRHARPSEPESTEVKGINLRLPKVYPRIPLCQSHNCIPGITDSDSEALIDTAVYPEFELYHSISLDETDGPMTATPLLSLYPRMRICMSPHKILDKVVV
jgi:hypothetical protein